jgi:hypothetical protein
MLHPLLSLATRDPLDDGDVSRIACRSLGPARSTREQAPYVQCAVRSWGGWCLSLARLCHGHGATRGAAAAGEC